MREVVKAKYIREVPSFLGILCACVTLPLMFGIWEDKEVTCGNCDHDFIAHWKRDTTRHAKCPACEVTNTW